MHDRDNAVYDVEDKRLKFQMCNRATEHPCWFGTSFYKYAFAVCK